MNPGNVFIHRRGTQTKYQSEAQKVFDRLRKNPRDPEALAWCERYHITYVYLSGNGKKSVEVRV